MVSSMAERTRRGRIVLLALTHVLAAAPAAVAVDGAPPAPDAVLDPMALERALVTRLREGFARGYVKVQEVGPAGVLAVVNAVPFEGGASSVQAAEILAGDLRDAVLKTFQADLDFASGSQFMVLTGERLELAGAGPILTDKVQDLAMDVVAAATRHGLGIQHLTAAAYSGPMVSLEVEARSVGFGPTRAEDVRRELMREVRDDLFGNGPWSYMAYIEEQSYVEVWDVPRPLDARPDLEPAAEPEPLPPARDWAVRAAPDPEPEPEPPAPGPESWPDPVGNEAVVPGMGEPAQRGRLPAADQWREGGAPLLPPLPEPAAPAAAPPPTSPPEPAVLRARGRTRPDFARLLREARARAPYQPPLPAPVAVEEPGPEPPREYPASPFGIGPGVASTVEMVYFDTDKHAVKPAERVRLQAMVAEYGADAIRNVTVVGHADSRNTNPYNLALGKRRAQAVKDFLVELGVREPRVVVKSFGEEDPIRSNDTDLGRSLNRRAQIHISYQDPDRRLHNDRYRDVKKRPSRQRPTDTHPDGIPKLLDP